MKVILNTGKKNIHGLNGKPLSLKEIVDRRVSVIVPQSLLAPADRRGTAATRVIDFVPSDIVEYVGAQDFTLEAAEEIAADSAAADATPDTNEGPALFTAQEDETATAVASEDLTTEGAEAAVATTGKGKGKNA